MIPYHFQNLALFLETETKGFLMDELAEGAEKWKGISLDELLSRFLPEIIDGILRLALVFVLFWVGRRVITWLVRLCDKALERQNVEVTVRRFLRNVLKAVGYTILVMILLQLVGVAVTSLAAAFASAGVAIGMALSGTLQNFAGGVLILLLKPYRIGDYIEAQGYAGTVREIQIFHTIICTPDNKSIIIPNGGLSTGSVNNYSRQEYRRVDWTVSISYGDNVDAARARILEILQADPDVVRSDSADNSMPVADCSPSVVVNELAASSVDLKVSAWTKTSSYWSLYYRINETIYNQLGSAGISFPFPQLDVHVQTNDKTRS